MIRQRVWILLTITLIFLVSCQKNQPAGSTVQTDDAAAPAVEAATPIIPTDTPADEPTAPIVPTEAPTAVPQPTITPPTSAPETAVTPPATTDITIEAADGLLLHATLSVPGGAAPFPGVILLHMLGSNRQVWTDNGFAEKLTADGYAVLALDMRGHGETGGDREWGKTEDDLQRVWAYFAGLDAVDEMKTAVIGASIGSNIALRTGANEPSIQTVILLSPGLDYRSVTTEDALERYGSRPLLIVASEEDTYAATSSHTLIEQAQGEAELKMYDGAGHGTNMFNPQPDVADLLLDWLNSYLK